nr:AraC family transcriptional regulator [Candidatus Desulfobacula maris]
LLETTNLNLEAIIDSVGYSDISSFSILFKRLTKLTPREYRIRFSMDLITPSK